MSTLTYLIRGAQILGEASKDIRISHGYIKDIADSLEENANDTVIDASQYIALPGLVDPHTHMREPGREDAETVLSASRAAAAGGYTSVSAMANTSPVQDNAGVVEQVYRLGKEAGYCDVWPVGAVTEGLKGEHLAQLSAMAHSQAKVRVFSDDGVCVSDPLIMRRALEYVKSFDGLIAQHAQEPRLTEGAQMHEGKVSADIGLTGWPSVAEEAIVIRDCLLAKHIDTRVHELHISTRGSVELIRWAKAQGIKVTAEVTPHHLTLEDEEARSFDPRFKVNPPLRTRDDIEALREGVADGTIDVIGTDHAPHPSESKDCEWAAGAHGMLGLETALPVIQQALIDTSIIKWKDIARLMSYQPAKLYGIEDQGLPIEVGNPAHICLYDPHYTWTVTSAMLHSKSTNTPWNERSLQGKPMYTFYKGVPTLWNGKLRSHNDVLADRKALEEGK
ncbi:MAG: dihydroorotase [Actinomycetaceae bacterium]|nr:dihydroorotase [Actinomycetaceae bacterium]